LIKQKILNETTCLCQAGRVEVDAEDEDQAAAGESDASDDEEVMEVDGKTAPTDIPMETDTASREEHVASKEGATSEAKTPAGPKPFVVASGLPQSTGELESLIRAIHQTVTNSVLPRLHKCLTAKVGCSHTRASFVRVYEGSKRQ